MANITYDGQSFFLSGKRIWLVSAAMHYPRIPRDLWPDRIRAAKQAGCNTIETYVFWNAHEPEPGRFDWTDNLDLRRFIELIGEAGMYAIVRPGPFVCAEWDFGGLPAWLHEIEDMALRQSNPAFVQCCARYLAAVMEQVRDLQRTVGNGPIIMMQNENEWFCHNDHAAEGYLDELNRHMREGGCTVPLINCNNLWQPVDNTIDCWNGWHGIFQDMRQLRLARPDAPRLVTELWPGWFDAWGGEHDRGKSPNDVLRRLCAVAAAGAQANLYMFHGGTNFGFWGGRTVGAPDHYITTSYDYDAPLMEAGGRGKKYLAAKRINTFLSQFAGLMANLKPDDHPTTIEPTDRAVSIVQQRGMMGSVTFLLRDTPAKAERVPIVTPDGMNLTVHFGTESAAWIVHDLTLPGGMILNRTNLRPWAMPDDHLLVLFGPAGTDASVVLDGVNLEATVPTGWQPKVIDHRGLRVAILNDKQVDAAYLTADQRLVIGAGGLDEHDQPLPGPSARCTLLAATGKAETRSVGKQSTRTRSPGTLGDWEYADCQNYTDGTAPQFAPIDGPRPLEHCGADRGYGWYRVKLTGVSGKHQLMLPEANDRIHLYDKGKRIEVLGFGPGAAEQPMPIQWHTAQRELVLLADNLGRFNYGQAMGELKGVFGHLYDVAPVRPGKPTIETTQPVDPFELTGFVYHARYGDRTPHPRHTFTVTHRKAAPLIVELFGSRPNSVLLVNGEPFALDPAGDGTARFVIAPERLKRGKNTITLAQYHPADADFRMERCLRVFAVQRVLSAEAEWSYARWEQPADDAFKPLPERTAAAPAWYRTRFTARDVSRPVFLEINRMSKGQIYLNGRNVGRYFVATPSGRKVPPQTRYYLPEPWFHADAENELILFDEHGRHPTHCRLVQDSYGPYGDWRTWDKP